MTNRFYKRKWPIVLAGSSELFIIFVVNFAEIYEDGEISLKNQKPRQNLNVFIQNITSKKHSNLNY